MIRAIALALALGFAALPAAAQEAVATDGDHVAIFAGGCFWCVESDFDKVPGVLSTVSGYIGGNSDNPTYYTHTRDNHREAVRIEFDPGQVDYEKLVEIFFRSVDPTDDGGQFCDRGHSYTTAIYTLGEEQARIAETGKAEAESALGQGVVTDIAPAPAFWPAEDYHQDYYQKNPLRYQYYRNGCGRDARLNQVWGDAALTGIKGS